MANLRTRVPGPDELYLLSLQQDKETRDRELYKDNPDNEEPRIYTKEVGRQIKYRRARELSMSRDQPPRLPCRSCYDNSNKEEWLGIGEAVKEYQQKRVDWYELDYPINNLENCLTCMDHRKCDDHLCMARRVSCYFCNSEKGPLRVRAKRLARRIAERPKRFD